MQCQRWFIVFLPSGCRVGLLPRLVKADGRPTRTRVCSKVSAFQKCSLVGGMLGLCIFKLINSKSVLSVKIDLALHNHPSLSFAPPGANLNCLILCLSFSFFVSSQFAPHPTRVVAGPSALPGHSPPRTHTHTRTHRLQPHTPTQPHYIVPLKLTNALW